MKKKASIILSISILILIAGCQQQTSEVSGDEEGQTLVISWPQDIGSMNPHGYGENQMFAQNLVYESLVKHDEEGQVQPHLAESWEISEDGKTYTFHLREDVEFSNGSSFDAEIVKKNFDHVLKNPEDHQWLELVNQINNTEVIDSSTFALTLEESYYPILEELALVRPFRFLADAGFSEAEDFQEPIGTGPWVLQEYRKDEEAVFHRNDDYWGKAPEVDKLIIRVIPDGEARVMAFENGEIDLIYGNGLISLDAYEHLQQSGQYESGSSPPQATRVFALNTDRGPTEDRFVRQAIIHAIDMQSAVEDLLHSTEDVVGSLFSENIPYYPNDLDAYAYDPVKAKELLEEAGWEEIEGEPSRVKGEKALQLSLVFDANDQIQQMLAEYAQSELQEIGIEVMLAGVDNQSYINQQKTGEFDMIYSETWGAPYDPHAMLSSMRVPAHADYQAQQGLEEKEELDEMIGAVLVENDEQQRAELYGHIIETLHEEAVYAPISSTSTIALYDSDLEGVRYSPINYEFYLESIGW